MTKEIVEGDLVFGELLERLKTNHHDSWHRFATDPRGSVTRRQLYKTILLTMVNLSAMN